LQECGKDAIIYLEIDNIKSGKENNFLKKENLFIQNKSK